MALPSLSWGRYIAIVLLYWVLVVGGWMFYATRPSTQRRAREQAVIAERKDPVTGGTNLTNSSTNPLPPNCAPLFRPPPALFIVWVGLFRRIEVSGCSPTNA